MAHAITSLRTHTPAWRTRFTELVGCDLPLQQAGMAWVAGPDLAAAVTEAGGLGMLAMPLVPALVLARLLAAVRARTAEPVGVTFLMPSLDLESVDVAARHARVVEFFYGEPDPMLVRRVHASGALASWQVGSVAEARAAAAAGCDLLVVQGTEAGGPVRGQLPLMALLAQVLDAVAVPVVAAGGIGSAAAMAAALAAGADAVRVGTRFVATPEADAHPRYIEALVRATAEDALLTTAFSTLWPTAHRVLGSAIEQAEDLDCEVAGHARITGVTAAMPIPRLGPMPPTKRTTGAIEAMALFAGLSVDNVRRVQPAAEIVRELVEGAQDLLEAAAARYASPGLIQLPAPRMISSRRSELLSALA